MAKMLDLPPHDPYSVQSKTDENGSRRYYICCNDIEFSYPSVTTVLGVMDEDWIREWKNVVGDEKANKVSRIATKKGQDVHDAIEFWLHRGSLSGFSGLPFTTPRVRRLFPILRRIEALYGIELALYSHALGLAGRADAIGYYDGVLSIIDFKTSKIPKEESDIQNYFAQGTAYGIMLYELFELVPEQVVIIISTEGQKDQVFKKSIQHGHNQLMRAKAIYENRHN